MVHSFFDILLSREHYTQPFTCPCGDSDPNQMYKHCLSLSQKVAVFAITFLLLLPTYGVGAIAAFYLMTAALKARNSVWTVYTSERYSKNSYFALTPAWWGISSNWRGVEVHVKRDNYSHAYRNPDQGAVSHYKNTITHITNNVASRSRQDSHITSHHPFRGNRGGYGKRQIPGTSIYI